MVMDWWKVDDAVASACQTLTTDIAEFVAEYARMGAPHDTGELMSKIGVVSSDNAFRTHVVSTAAHSVHVEFGHFANGTYVPAVPFMRNALAAARAAFPEIAGRINLAAPPRRTAERSSGAEGGGFGGASHLGVTVDTE
jgi:hypothetical protein